MKQYIIILLFATCFGLPLTAQTKKKSWGEVYFMLEQNLMLNKKFSNSEINKSIPTMNIPFLLLGLEVRVYEEFGLFWNMGFALNKQKKSFSEKMNFFPELNIDDYYQDIYFNGAENTMPFKNVVGIFYRFHKKDWTMIPQLGYGIMEADESSMVYTLKAKGTNKKYDVVYYTDKYVEVDVPAYLMLKLKAQRKLSKRFLLNLSAEYNLHFYRNSFMGRYSDYYDNMEMGRTDIIRGNRMHGVTFGVGIGFR